MLAISGKFIPNEVRRRRRHASGGLVLVVQQLGVKIVPFMIKEWNLAHLQLIFFLKKLDIGPSQICHVTNMAAFLKKGLAFLHLPLRNL